MNRMQSFGLVCLLAATGLSGSRVSAAEKAETAIPLTEAGEKLFAQYTDRLKGLGAEIARALPNVDEQKKADFLKAYQAEAAATSAELGAMRAQDEKGAKDKVEQAQLAEADRIIVVGQDGAIMIPAVAFSKPAGNTPQFVSMKGFSDGTQLHCVRDLKAAQEFEYTFEAPQVGTYALAARVVTVQSDQKLLLSPNDAKNPVEIAIPYTVGTWGQTPPVELILAKGQNVLRFTRPAPSRGLTIKQFTLTPVKQ